MKFDVVVGNPPYQMAQAREQECTSELSGVNLYSIPNIAKMFARELAVGARDNFYYVSILKRVVKSAYKVELINQCDMIEQPVTTGDENWDAVLAGLGEYIAIEVFDVEVPNWIKLRQLRAVFEPLKEFFPQGYQTEILEAFKNHNVLLPEGSLRCLTSMKKNS